MGVTAPTGSAPSESAGRDDAGEGMGRWKGAEADVGPDGVEGRLSKTRPVKGYRHPTLDRELRTRRTRDEAHLMIAARKAGVDVPVVYDLDRTRARLVLERIRGTSLRAWLPTAPPENATEALRTLGAMVARLHQAGITHGDLTTSNVLVQAEDAIGAASASPSATLVSTRTPRLVLIDFGLGQMTEETEPRGVDLHLVEEALEATDPRADTLFAAFREGYAWEGSASVLARLEEIRERGRYR